MIQARYFTDPSNFILVFLSHLVTSGFQIWKPMWYMYNFRNKMTIAFAVENIDFSHILMGNETIGIND